MCFDFSFWDFLIVRLAGDGRKKHEKKTQKKPKRESCPVHEVNLATLEVALMFQVQW